MNSNGMIILQQFENFSELKGFKRDNEDDDEHDTQAE